VVVTAAGNITAVVPLEGSHLGGDMVTIIGNYLGNGWDIYNTTFAGVSGATILSQSSTRVCALSLSFSVRVSHAPMQILVRTGPARALPPGPFPVGRVVTSSTLFGTSTSNASFTYTLGVPFPTLFPPNSLLSHLVSQMRTCRALSR
jgi:hypothetical protein